MGPARRRYLPIDRARQRQSAGCCRVALDGRRDVGGTALPARARRGPLRLRPISAALVLRADIACAPLETTRRRCACGRRWRWPPFGVYRIGRAREVARSMHR